MILPTFKTNQYALKPYKLEDEDRFVEMVLDPVSVSKKLVQKNNGYHNPQEF